MCQGNSMKCLYSIFIQFSRIYLPYIVGLDQLTVCCYHSATEINIPSWTLYIFYEYECWFLLVAQNMPCVLPTCSKIAYGLSLYDSVLFSYFKSCFSSLGALLIVILGIDLVVIDSESTFWLTACIPMSVSTH